MPVVVNDNNQQFRGILVVMVTSGGSNYPNGTFYTKVKVMVMEMQRLLVVSGGAITEFGETIQLILTFQKWFWIILLQHLIYLQISLLMQTVQLQYSGARVEQLGLMQLLVQSKQLLTQLLVLVLMILQNLVDIMLCYNQKFTPSDSDVVQVNDFRRVGIVKNPKDTCNKCDSPLATARKQMQF